MVHLIKPVLLQYHLSLRKINLKKIFQRYYLYLFAPTIITKVVGFVLGTEGLVILH